MMNNENGHFDLIGTLGKHRDLLERVGGRNLQMLQHSRGLAWTLEITLDGDLIGIAEHQGTGGTTEVGPPYYATMAETQETQNLDRDALTALRAELENRINEIGNALTALGCGFTYPPGPYADSGSSEPDWDIFTCLEPGMTLYDAVEAEFIKEILIQSTLNTVINDPDMGEPASE